MKHSSIFLALVFALGLAPASLAAPITSNESFQSLADEPILDDGIGVIGEAVLGNPTGERVVYKYYDTNCGYCRADYQRLISLAEEYPDLRIVLVQTAILGAASESAAQALAGLPGPVEYFTVVNEIMTDRYRSSDRAVQSIAERFKLEIEQSVSEQIKSARTEKLDANLRSFTAHGGNGVPFFVDPNAANGDASTSKEFGGSRLGFVEKIACGYSGPGSCESARVLVEDAISAFEAGQVEASRSFFVRATMDAKTRSLDGNEINRICWNGAIMGAAADVLSICEELVQKFPGNMSFVDSRGVAYAAIGAAEPAIKDLSDFLAARPQLAAEQRSLRQNMISQLAVEGSPIDQLMLSGLK